MGVCRNVIDYNMALPPTTEEQHEQRIREIELELAPMECKEKVRHAAHRIAMLETKLKKAREELAEERGM
jgi:hypothetical protein